MGFSPYSSPYKLILYVTSFYYKMYFEDLLEIADVDVTVSNVSFVQTSVLAISVIAQMLLH